MYSSTECRVSLLMAEKRLFPLNYLSSGGIEIVHPVSSFLHSSKIIHTEKTPLMPIDVGQVSGPPSAWRCGVCYSVDCGVSLLMEQRYGFSPRPISNGSTYMRCTLHSSSLANHPRQETLFRS